MRRSYFLVGEVRAADGVNHRLRDSRRAKVHLPNLLFRLGDGLCLGVGGRTVWIRMRTALLGIWSERGRELVVGRGAVDEAWTGRKKFSCWQVNLPPLLLEELWTFKQ